MSARALNIWSRSDEEIGRLMSHFAHTPFELDGVSFASVEAFYTWLLVDETRRPKVAQLWGPRSKHACPKVTPAQFDYHGRAVVFDSPEHMDLILQANRAKMVAHPEIARAFAATAPRPIVHALPDKPDEPHDAFCRIMNAIRDELCIGR